MGEDEVWPDGLPVLGAGAHQERRGACVMEYAALLSGDVHSDHPSAVHPILADLCRRANDSVRDDTRVGLVRLVPALIGTAGRADHEEDVETGARAIIEVCRRHLARLGAPCPPPPIRVPERIDPGAGGGTAVLDRPVADSPARAHHYWAHRAFYEVWGERRDDRGVVELIEEMVHEVRAAQGLAPVATSGPSS